ncbi:MAG: hypothetical protein ACI4TF_03405 [Oliverpabstia sp.]
MTINEFENEEYVRVNWQKRLKKYGIFTSFAINLIIKLQRRKQKEEIKSKEKLTINFKNKIIK